jgi:hypothetical protein
MLESHILVLSPFILFEVERVLRYPRSSRVNESLPWKRCAWR